MTAQELAALVTEKITRDLVTLVQATPEDRLYWEPMETGRSIFDQVVECSIANTKWTRILQTHVYSNLNAEERAIAGFEQIHTKEAAIAKLQETSALLVGAIRGLPDADATKAIPLPWEPTVTRTLAEGCLHAYWNMVYHEGQINYVQTLYGDMEEHGDIGPFGK